MRGDSEDKLQPWQAPMPEPYMPGVLMPSEALVENRRDYLALFARRKWVMLATLLIVFGLGMLYTFTRRPIYESSARIVVASSTGAGLVTEDEAPLLTDLRALTRSRSVETQVEMISSPDLLREAYASLAPEIRTAGFGAGKLPNWASRVRAVKNTDVILVTCRAFTPTAAAALANTIANVYFRRDLERNTQATRQARRYAGEQMVVAQKQLERASAELARFKRSTGLFAPEEQLARVAEQKVRLSMDLDAAKAQLAAERRQAAAMRRALSGERHNVITNTTVAPNPQREAILQRIDSLNSQRAGMLQEYTPESREVRDTDERIRLEEARLKQMEATVVASRVQARNPVRDSLAPAYASMIASVSASSARVRALQEALAEKESQVQSLPERERGLAERLQRVAMLQRTYEALSAKYNALLMTEQATLPTGMLVASARAEDEPTYPKHGRSAALFLMIGLLASVVAAVLAERLDRRIHDEESAEQATNLPSLSIVPRVEDGSPLLLADGGSRAAVLESFRILRNGIEFLADDRGLKVVAVTSAGRQEGKSTTSVNLAVAMAMEGKRVLLVDADMRRPSLHRLLGVPSEIGLSTVLAGKSSVNSAIRPTAVTNVECLPAGPIPPNGAEMLNSRESRELFRALADDYDSVVVDCPPAAGLSDVQVISTLVDGVLLVVSIDQTLKPQLDTTIRALRQAGARLIGVVLNRMQTRRWGYGYYDYCEDPAESEAASPNL